jgi:3-methyl-2-oxobutanoate hydroxymethyltransferase
MSAAAADRPVTLPYLTERMRRREPIVMVTAYDLPSAQVAEAAAVDLVLDRRHSGDDRPGAIRPRVW